MNSDPVSTEGSPDGPPAEWSPRRRRKPDFTQPRYWRRRSRMKYYRRATHYARRFAPWAESTLDVGSSHCEYINRLDWIPRRERIDLYPLAPLAGVVDHQCDFMAFEPESPFDVVLCLQLLEHLERPDEFCAKLLAAGRVVILSVPYRWPADSEGEHVQDPVDEDKVLSWTGRRWLSKSIVQDGTGSQSLRLVAVFKGDACSRWRSIGLRLRAIRP